HHTNSNQPKPRQSKGVRPSEVCVSGTKKKASAIANNTTGTATKKMAGHDHKSTSTPPNTGAEAGPSTAPKPYKPMAKPRCCMGNTAKMVSNDNGCTTP